MFSLPVGCTAFILMDEVAQPTNVSKAIDANLYTIAPLEDVLIEGVLSTASARVTTFSTVKP